MSNEVFRHPHRVIYSECTVGNHIYYARYLDLLEEARGEFFRHLGDSFASLQEKDAIFPVIEAHVYYKAPARYDDLLSIELWLLDLGKVRLTFGYRIVKETGALLLEAVTNHVCAGLNERPRRLPEELARMLHPYLASGPPEAPESPRRL